MSNAAVVAGAAGAVGEACALALKSKGWRVVGTLRRDRAGAAARLRAAGVELMQLDVCETHALGALTRDADALVFTPNLQLLIPTLPLIGAKHIIALSSNNVAIAPDTPVYRDLAVAESALRITRPDALILRPTMIYGDPRLETVTRLMRLARRWPVMPLPGSGRALVQPVFHGDLGAMAASLVVDRPNGGRTFAVGGPDIVSFAILYAQIAQAAGARTLQLPIPLWALRGAARLGVRIPLDASQLGRAEADRRVVVQDELPTSLVPSTPLSAGLAFLARALDGGGTDI